MHPAESIRSERDSVLEGKRIVLGITGSIAAVRCFELSRELIRHGADITAVLTPEAEKIVTPDTLEFATGRPPITDIRGQVEHVGLCGDHGERVDLMLVAPCTANTISKVALGIADTPVTTTATVAMGSGVPILMVPAMHASMYSHPAVKDNVEKLRGMGVGLIGPYMAEGKARMAEVGEIVARTIRALGDRSFRGRKVLVIGGSSEEAIDDMRVITNRGTGETAVRLAERAFFKGGDIELWMGRNSTDIPSYIEVKDYTTLEELTEMAEAADHDLILVPAALSDYAPEKRGGKVPSDEGEILLTLRPLPKLLPVLRKKDCTLVGFKAEHGLGEEELENRARRRLERDNLDAIVANDLRNVKTGKTDVLLLTRRTIARFSGTKGEVADDILNEIRKVME